MKCTFHIQDPTNQNTLYLYEAIIEQLMKTSLESWRGIFAFATGSALHNLFIEDPVVKSFLNRGEINIIIGVDAITNVMALEKLTSISEQSNKFNAKIFINPSNRLFHPKISHFRHKNGTSVLIVGSGNMTSGGLRSNIEAFVVIEGTENELSSISTWDDFLIRHHENIKDINEEAFERARQNTVEARQRRRKKRKVKPEEVEVEEALEQEEPILEDSRVLVACVPAAGGRWNQIHYNKEVVNKFFRTDPNSSQRLFLREIKLDKTLGPDEVRPLVYSHTNKNFKVEIAAKRGEDYPKTPPIIILREVGLRSYYYVLLMPGDNGYNEMFDFTKNHPSLGKGLKRVLTKMSVVLNEWPNCPL